MKFTTSLYSVAQIYFLEWSTATGVVVHTCSTNTWTVQTAWATELVCFKTQSMEEGIGGDLGDASLQF